MTESIDRLRHDTMVHVLVRKDELDDGNASRCLGCPILDRRHNVVGFPGYASNTIVSADYTSADAAEDEAALRRVNCVSHKGVHGDTCHPATTVYPLRSGLFRVITTAQIGLRGPDRNIKSTGTYGPNGIVPASYMHNRPEGSVVQIVARNNTEDYKPMGAVMRPMRDEEVSRVLARHATNFVAGARRFVARAMRRR